MAESISTEDHVMYRSLQKNPIEINRHSTDRVFIFIFGTLFSFWIGVNIYVAIFESTFYINDGIDRLADYKLMRENTKPKWLSDIINYNTMVRVAQYFQKCGLEIIIWNIICGIILLLSFLILLRWIPKICIYIGVICLVFLICLCIYNISFNIMNYNKIHDDFWKLITIISNSVNLIFFIAALMSLKSVQIITLVDIMKKSCRAIFFYRTLILFGVLILLLDVFIIVFTIKSLQILDSYNPLFYVTFFGGIYLFFFVYYFGKMVISEIIATWHWKKNKEEIPNTIIFRCIFTVGRYHLGSVAFGATFILPLCLSIYTAYKIKCDIAETSNNSKMKKIFMIFLIFNMSNYALILISVHGVNFFQAIKRTFRLMIKNSLLSLALIYIFYVILVIGSIFAISLSIALPKIFWKLDDLVGTDDQFIIIIKDVIKIAIPLLMPVIIIAETAVHTTLLCTLEDTEDLSCT